MVIIRKHVSEISKSLKFGDSWGFLRIEVKSSAAAEEGFELLLVKVPSKRAKHMKSLLTQPT